MKKRYVIEYRHNERGYRRVAFSNKVKFLRYLLMLTRNREDIIVIGWTDTQQEPDKQWMLDIPEFSFDVSNVHEEEGES